MSWAQKVFFFLERRWSVWSVTVQNYLGSWVRTSDRDGMFPSVMHTSACDGSTNDPAKDTAHTVLNILVQRRSHTNAIWCVMKDGTSRAFAWANCQMKSTASLLHLPPVSKATHETAPPIEEFGVLVLLIDPCLQQDCTILFCRTLGFATPRQNASEGHVNSQLWVSLRNTGDPGRAPRSASHQKRQPWRSYLSRERWTWLGRLLLCKFWTSLALLWMRPDGAPNGSSGSWQPEHVDSVRNRGNPNRSRNSTWNKCGWMVNSSVVGAWDNAHPELCPEWDLRWAWRATLWPASMDNFRKRESKVEEAQYCQPCGHSPGSRALPSGGLLPSRNSTQLGRHWNPCMSKRTEASCSSCKHPWKSSWDDNWSTTSVATAGLRSAIMGKASAHDAQKAAGAHLSAERKPNPHIRIGNVEMFRASSSSSAGMWPSSLLAVSHIPSSWARQWTDDWLGGIVLIVWFARGFALQEELARTLRSGTVGIVDHNSRSFVMRSSIFLEMYCSEPTGVPNTVIPSGCQTSTPTSPMLSGTTPVRFQALVFPWWCNSIPAHLNKALSSSLNNGFTLASWQNR